MISDKSLGLLIWITLYIIRLATRECNATEQINRRLDQASKEIMSLRSLLLKKNAVIESEDAIIMMLRTIIIELERSIHDLKGT